MKKITTLFLFITLTFLAFAQPQKMSYQAIVRGPKGELLVEKKLNFVVRIIENSANGDAIYEESHEATTNKNGLVTLAIGNGNQLDGVFEEIQWHKTDFYVQVATDPTGGTNYELLTSSQLLSVPYALHARSAGEPGDKVGDMKYWDGNEWKLIKAGKKGQYLQMGENGVPAWEGVATPGEPVLGTVITSDIELASVILKSEIFGDGGNQVSARGFTLDTLPNPDINDLTIAAGSDIGVFSAYASNLKVGQTYYVRAYATNSMGTVYGQEVSFNTKTPKVGETGPAGGIIFYLDGKGGGMECAPEQNDYVERWYSTWAPYTYANSKGIGSGDTNTQKIVNVLGTRADAANRCDTFQLNGYNDWFLPSQDEMKRIYTNLHQNGIGGFKLAHYWTSTQTSTSKDVYYVDFASSGAIYDLYAYREHRVRPVRKF